MIMLWSGVGEGRMDVGFVNVKFCIDIGWGDLMSIDGQRSNPKSAV